MSVLYIAQNALGLGAVTKMLYFLQEINNLLVVSKITIILLNFDNMRS